MAKKKKSRPSSTSLDSTDDPSTVVQHERRDASSRENVKGVQTVMASLAILVSTCFLVKSQQKSVESLESARTAINDGICNAAESNNGACAICNDDTSKVNNKVPQQCNLVMAPSGILNSGWGVFTLTPRKKGQRITEQGDLIIHVPDPNPNHALKMRRLVWDYLWNGEDIYGHYEGLHVISAASGFGSLANGVAKEPNLSHNIPSADDAGLKRGKSPGAGAISHHHNYTWTVEKDLDAGDELFVEYGEGWITERGFEATVSPSKFDVRHLREVGYCLDNLVPDTSLIDDAGRGAFASRDLDKGSIIAPLPLVPLSRSSVEMIYESRKDESLLVRTQLLRNYCFGHANSSLLLYPYSQWVNLINHDSIKPNVRLQWWEGSRVYFDKPLLELQQKDTSQLMLELVATRQISKDEEIVLDYGRDWAKAWKDQVESWQPRDEDINHVSAEILNNDGKFLVLRTAQEQHSKPYPADVFTSCYYQHSGQSMDNAMANASNSAPARTTKKWKPDLIASQNLRPCIVLKRDKADESYLYTVQIMNRPTLAKSERIPKGHVLIATHVPRHAIAFSDKTYTSDQHLENAFRKEIGLGDIFPEQWKDLL